MAAYRPDMLARGVLKASCSCDVWELEEVKSRTRRRSRLAPRTSHRSCQLRREGAMAKSFQAAPLTESERTFSQFY